MFGKGLLTGMKITFKRMVGPNITEYYPEERPNLPPTTRSSMAFDPDKCISCGICLNACPNKVITLSSEKDENNKKILKSYEMNVGRCLFCGMCTEVCPVAALKVTQEYENAIYNHDELIWDMIARSKRSIKPSRKEG